MQSHRFIIRCLFLPLPTFQTPQLWSSDVHDAADPLQHRQLRRRHRDAQVPQEDHHARHETAENQFRFRKS